MTFRVFTVGPKGEREPVLNGWTKREASWPTAEAAQAWIDYWSVHPATAMKYEVHEHKETA